VPTVAEIRLWGRRIGAVSLTDGANVAAVQYDPEFARSQFQVAPIVMPLSERIFSFPRLPLESFHGLPGLLADSLPDKFGNALIDAWLATQGRRPENFNAVERLCYVGSRGMGALEFVPATGPSTQVSAHIQMAALVQLASDVLTQRTTIATSFASEQRRNALEAILRIGTSAGGARAKVVIAWNPNTGEVRSGQIASGDGFEYWLLKFDGVSGNIDKELEDPIGYGAIEFAYYRMATAAGIEMSECRLLEEGGRRHFMTRRFDRSPDGAKIHMQSLAALAHFDFNRAGAHSYEQAFAVIRQLELPMAATEQQFRRAVFNIVARNQDDHVKNIAFLMDKSGRWSLAPTYNVTYSFNPAGLWTARHQMTLNGRQEQFTLGDFRAAAKAAGMKRGRAEVILAEVCRVVGGWPNYAEEARVDEASRHQIQRNLFLTFDRS
jgi:serine/threonine-protein kinase HipA